MHILSALQTTVAGKGNCQIYTKSYTGTGTYNVNNPSKLTFPGKPELVFIGGMTDAAFLVAFYGQTLAATQSTTNVRVDVSWSGNTMSWYSNTNALGQLNTQGTQYLVVALISQS